MRALLDQVSELSGFVLSDPCVLSGGEQGGAVLAASPAGDVVIKIQQDQTRAARLLAAAPAVMASQSRWAVGRWLAAGPIPTGGAFYLQEFVPGTPLEVTDLEQIDAVIAANARQRGLGVPDMFDHAAQIVAVTAGQHAWFDDVARRSQAGASVAQQGRTLVASAGATSLPSDDIVHGDLSASNVIIDSNGAARFIDSETTGRGHRAQDLADLYRQCVVGGLAPAPVLARLVRGGVIAAGSPQFITCVVGAALNNLAWHATNQPLAEFDRMCSRVQHVLARVHNDCTTAITDQPPR